MKEPYEDFKERKNIEKRGPRGEPDIAPEATRGDSQYAPESDQGRRPEPARGEQKGTPGATSETAGANTPSPEPSFEPPLDESPKNLLRGVVRPESYRAEPASPPRGKEEESNANTPEPEPLSPEAQLVEYDEQLSEEGLTPKYRDSLRRIRADLAAELGVET